MANVPVRWLLFFSSYIPLMLVFCVLMLGKQPYWALGILLFAALVFVVMLLYFFVLTPSLDADPPVRVRDLQVRDNDVMSYIATYLLPFVVYPLDGWQPILALAIVLLVLGFIYVNSNMIYINPMLNMVGFHLYDITVATDEKHYSLVAHRRVSHGDIIHPISIGNAILLEKKAKRQ